MRLMAVCKHCKSTVMDDDKNMAMEINFLSGKIFWVCPQCQKENIFEAPDTSKLPRMRTIR